MSGCRFIAPPDARASRFSASSGEPYAIEHSFFTTQPEQVIGYHGNTAVGYRKARKFILNTVNTTVDLNSTAFLPEQQNVGWKLLDERP